MGSGKHTTIEERRIIWKMHEGGRKVAEIAKILNISRKKVYNAINSCVENPDVLINGKIRKPRSRKTDARTDAAIVRMVKNDPFKSSRQIASDINQSLSTKISSRLVRRRLNEANLFGRISRKKPLLSKINISKRLNFAKTHQEKGLNFWKNVLWSDETKINRIGPDGRIFVHRPICQECNPRFTQKTVKHGGGNIMVWGAFSWHGIGPLVRINGKMDKFQYLDILKHHMEPYAFDSMPIKWKFMQDNDPKHSSKLVKNWFSAEKIDVLDWPAQSPDLNPIENLWNEVKIEIAKKNYKNLDDLWSAVQEAWYAIPKIKCEKLVESMNRRCEAVIKNKGYSTKY